MKNSLNYRVVFSAPFKLLLAGSGPKNFDRNTYYGALNEPNNESVQRDGDVDDHDEGDVSSSEELTDYEYAQNCEDAINLQRLLSESWNRLKIYISA